jgi:hypothetical protein
MLGRNLDLDISTFSFPDEYVWMDLSPITLAFLGVFQIVSSSKTRLGESGEMDHLSASEAENHLS